MRAATSLTRTALVAAPRQRNTEAEKARIKAGEKARDIWPDKPAKARQKDTDARWTVKFSKARPREDGAPQLDIAVPHFGYKSHISIDRRHGVIRRERTTDAAAHDGARLAGRQRRHIRAERRPFEEGHCYQCQLDLLLVTECACTRSRRARNRFAELER
jgi:hypothetical protein